MANPRPGPKQGDLAAIKVVGNIEGTDRIRTIAVNEDGAVVFTAAKTETSEATRTRRLLEEILVTLKALYEAQVGAERV